MSMLFAPMPSYRVDNIADAGYEYVRRVRGAQYAKSITLPLLQARRACGSDAVCIKDRQISAIRAFERLGAPISDQSRIASDPSPQTQERLWSHNGSTAYLVAQGRSRKFFYKEPRPGMLSAGAKPGSLIFEGEAIG